MEWITLRGPQITGHSGRTSDRRKEKEKRRRKSPLEITLASSMGHWMRWPYPRIQVVLSGQQLQDVPKVLKFACMLGPILKSNEGKKLVPLGDAKEIFPSTRPLPLQIPKYTVSQRAEQGVCYLSLTHLPSQFLYLPQAHFLRTYFPDIEIPAELIRDEINAETRVMRQLEKYDPYAGNLLDIIICEDGPRHQKAFLCFPMGESNRDLSGYLFKNIFQHSILNIHRHITVCVVANRRDSIWAHRTCKANIPDTYPADCLIFLE